jgi:hypothetical protein
MDWEFEKMKVLAGLSLTGLNSRRFKMEQFWQKEKYQLHEKHQKAASISKLMEEALITTQNITALPSYSSLKSIFKNLEGDSSGNLEEMKKSIIKRIGDKTTKRRKHQWEHDYFDTKLTKKIEEFTDPKKLKSWIGVFAEYYKLLKSENKND